jgi:hypothetical protein
MEIKGYLNAWPAASPNPNGVGNEDATHGSKAKQLSLH